VRDMKLEFTPAQLEALKRLTDDVDSMIGCGESESDTTWAKNVDLIDRMLKKNGLSRYFKQERD